MAPQRSWPSTRGIVGSAREHGPRRVTFVEAVIAVVIVVAIAAMAVWFIFISSGGIGPGSV